MIARFHLPFAFAVLAAGCQATLPAGEFSANNITVRSSMSPAEASQLAATAEKFTAEVSDVLECRPPVVEIIVFDGMIGKWRYLCQQCPDFANRRSVCFQNGDHISVVLSRGGVESGTALRHELTHAVIASNFAQPMPWLDEGLAQLFENGTFDASPQSFDFDNETDARLRRLLVCERHQELDADDYLIAREVTRYLITQYGMDRVRQCLMPPMAGENQAQRLTRCAERSPQELAAEFAENGKR